MDRNTIDHTIYAYDYHYKSILVTFEFEITSLTHLIKGSKFPFYNTIFAIIMEIMYVFSFLKIDSINQFLSSSLMLQLFFY